MHEKCGIAGVIDLTSDRNVLPYAKTMARSLQHRGELGAGIAWVRDGCIEVIKNNGLVRNVLDGRKLRHHSSSAAVAHTRYATSGSRDPALCQPFTHDGEHSASSFALGFNGNIANHPLLAAEYFSKGEPLEFDVDTDVIRRIMIESVRTGSRDSMRRAFASMHERLDGSLSLAAVTGDGGLYAYRQSPAIRPLVYGEVDGFLAVASEDSAITAAWPNARVHDLPSGHMLRAQAGEWSIDRIAPDAKNAHCFFEWIYFARYLSTLDDASVADVRRRLGASLAEADLVAGTAMDAVVPVPQSALLAAEGYALRSGLPVADAVRIAKKGRTFIEGDSRERKRKSAEKYALEPGEETRGKSIVVIDDSIVRGTTMTQLLRRIRRELRPAQIHLRIACPPILSPCFYGIDFPTFNELLARHHFDASLPSGYLPQPILDDIAKVLGVRTLRFVSLDDVAIAIGKPLDRLCTACVSGRYPTETGRALHESMLGARAPTRDADA